MGCFVSEDHNRGVQLLETLAIKISLTHNLTHNLSLSLSRTISLSLSLSLSLSHTISFFLSLTHNLSLTHDLSLSHTHYTHKHRRVLFSEGNIAWTHREVVFALGPVEGETVLDEAVGNLQLERRVVRLPARLQHLQKENRSLLQQIQGRGPNIKLTQEEVPCTSSAPAEKELRGITAEDPGSGACTGGGGLPTCPQHLQAER